MVYLPPLCGMNMRMDEKQQARDSTRCALLSSILVPSIKCCGGAIDDHTYHLASLKQRQKPPTLLGVFSKLLPGINKPIQEQPSKTKAKLLHPLSSDLTTICASFASSGAASPQALATRDVSRAASTAVAPPVVESMYPLKEERGRKKKRKRTIN